MTHFFRISEPAVSANQAYHQIPLVHQSYLNIKEIVLLSLVTFFLFLWTAIASYFKQRFISLSFRRNDRGRRTVVAMIFRQCICSSNSRLGSSIALVKIICCQYRDLMFVWLSVCSRCQHLESCTKIQGCPVLIFRLVVVYSHPGLERQMCCCYKPVFWLCFSF